MNFLSKIAITISVILISLSSCSKEKDDETIINDEYYVKYVVKCNQGRWYVHTFSINTDKGIQSFNDYKSTSWTQTYGPVKKGFKASATAQSSFPTIEIYVSKNQSPFALKTSKTSSTKVSESYTIDY